MPIFINGFLFFTLSVAQCIIANELGWTILPVLFAIPFMLTPDVYWKLSHHHIDLLPEEVIIMD